MPTTILTRAAKGHRLTSSELDANLLALRDTADAAMAGVDGADAAAAAAAASANAASISATAAQNASNAAQSTANAATAAASAAQSTANAANAAAAAAQTTADTAVSAAATAQTAANNAGTAAATAQTTANNANAAAAAAQDAADAAQETADEALTLAQQGGGGGGISLNTPLTGLDTSDAGDVVAANSVLVAFGKLQAKFNGLLTTIRGTALTGLSTASSADVAAADSILAAFGKLQAKFNVILTTIRGATLSGLSLVDSSDVVAGDSILSALGKLQAKFNGLAASVRAVVLTGLSTATNAAIAASDTILVALGKLQAQIDVRPTINAPITLNAATNLNAADHANRMIIWNGSNAALTIQTDAAGGTTADDEYVIVTADSSPGVPILTFPGGATLPGTANTIVGAIRKGANNWQQFIIPKDVFGENQRGLVPAASAVPSATKVLAETGAWVTMAGGTVPDRLFGEPSFMVVPINGTANNSSFGLQLTNFDSSVNTSVANATTSKYNSIQRTGQTGAAAAISRLAGTVCTFTSPLMSPSVALNGSGFRARTSGAIADGNTAGQFATGFSVSSPAWSATVEPSAMVNCVMLAGDSTDAQLTVMHNDASGTCTKVALNGGSGFPNNTNVSDMYTFEVDFRSNGTTRSIAYTAKNLVTGVSASGTLTTNIPAENVRLQPFTCRGSANQAVTPVVQWTHWAAGAFI